MPRMIDDLRVAGRVVKPWLVAAANQDDWWQHTIELWEALRDPNLTVLLLDNVADYYFGNDQEYWSFATDFPNMAPPYQVFWAEYRLPAKIHSAEVGDTPVGLTHGRVGILVVALKVSDIEEASADERLANAEWVVTCEIFIDYGFRRDEIQGPHGTVLLAINKEGGIEGNPWMRTYCREHDKDKVTSLITWIHPVMLGVSFLHCHNVTVEEQRMPKPLAKKFRAKHNVEPTRFKTLVIEPLKAILRTEGRSGEVGLPKALHICRGHFRDYREGRGLFGKYHALVWTPMTVRGTKGKTEDIPAREIKIKV